MTDELKTLKDLHCSCGCQKDPHYIRFCDFPDVDIKELRQEAIKWIKHLEETKNYDVKDVDNTYGIINWIAEFFNITEEELK